MSSNRSSSFRTQPPPTGRPLHRCNSPEKSVDYCLACDASLGASPRRNSSSNSHGTGQSDPQKWFDHSNQNPTATIGNNTIDIDFPFFQPESSSSNSESPYSQNQYQLAPPNLSMAHSSSADDYRSVIDDLTIEIQQLKEELKRYRQTGPDILRKDTLFEIRIHGLPEKKKRELEAILRDFAANLDRPPDASSLRRKKSSRHNRDHIHSGSGTRPKHASSSPPSNFRPADSAYASMSTGAKSASTCLSGPIMSSNKSSKQKVEDYLRNIPDGLYPRHMIMTDKERKNLVVRRLERLFTCKVSNRRMSKKQSMEPGDSFAFARVVGDAQTTGLSTALEPPTLGAEPIREARILPLEQQSRRLRNMSRFGGHGSASTPDEDHTGTGGNGNSTGPGIKPSPPVPPLPEQRRPCDLDPDRAQISSEIMNYIRHMGLVPSPELLPDQDNIHPDAEGWVYLNLLCNLPQLQIMNMTPDFVRSAVPEISTNFQLSPDGRKIRWRGGSEGTKFSRDSSDYNSQKSPFVDDIEGSEKKRRRPKTSRSTGNKLQSGGSSKDTPKFDPRLYAPFDSFHYKPLFVPQDSSGGHTPMDETDCPVGPAKGDNLGEPGLDLNCTSGSTREKQRHEGAIIYYSGTPFCIDLSGDPVDMSPATHMVLRGQTHKNYQQASYVTPSPPRRTASGSFINHRPLTDRGQILRQQSSAIDEDNNGLRGLTYDDSEPISDIELDLIWPDDQQYIEYPRLEPSGLGGVFPEDHFMVVIATKRPKQATLPSTSESQVQRLNKSTEGIIHRLATVSTSCPVLGGLKTRPSEEPPPIEFEYLSGRIKRLAPVQLPSPAIFFPPFSTDDSTSDEDDGVPADIDNTGYSEERVSRWENPYHSDSYPDGLDVSSGVEEGGDPDESSQDQKIDHVNRDTETKMLPNRTRQATRCTSSVAATGRKGTAAGIPQADDSSGEDSS
ncbi:hypothetical protein NW757_014768 [Fusarium falciforme]|nr:hypothetical protein NW757_014768 [Fusarium falciforme]